MNVTRIGMALMAIARERRGSESGAGTEIMMIRVDDDQSADSITVSELETGNFIPVVRVYWFAWQAFYPDTLVWEPLARGYGGFLLEGCSVF